MTLGFPWEFLVSLLGANIKLGVFSLWIIDAVTGRWKNCNERNGSQSTGRITIVFQNWMNESYNSLLCFLHQISGFYDLEGRFVWFWDQSLVRLALKPKKDVIKAIKKRRPTVIKIWLASIKHYYLHPILLRMHTQCRFSLTNTLRNIMSKQIIHKDSRVLRMTKVLQFLKNFCRTSNSNEAEPSLALNLCNHPSVGVGWPNSYIQARWLQRQLTTGTSHCRIWKWNETLIKTLQKQVNSQNRHLFLRTLWYKWFFSGTPPLAPAPCTVALEKNHAVFHKYAVFKCTFWKYAHQVK